MNVGVRPMRADDIERVQEIERDAGLLFVPLGMPGVADDDPPDRDQLAEYVDAERGWVVDPPPDVAAYVLVDLVDGAAHIEQVTVATRYARRRLGALLIDHVAGWARRHGIETMTLTTFREVPWNRPYYARLGFDDVAEQDVGPELAAVLAHERDHGLWRWPRVVMAKSLAAPWST